MGLNGVAVTDGALAEGATVTEGCTVDIAVGVPGPLQPTRSRSPTSMTAQRRIILCRSCRTGRCMRSRIGGVLLRKGMKKDGPGALLGAGCVAGGCGFLFFR